MGDGRSARRLLVAALAVAFALTLARAAALAIDISTTSLPLPGSQFQGGDGNQNNEGLLIDWQGLQADGRVQHVADPNAQDNVFQSAKESAPDDWVLTTANNGASPASANIRDVYQALSRGSSGDLFLYMAFTREASNGTVFVTFELNQDPRLWTNSTGERIPCRTTGDILISFEPHGNGASVRVERWVTDTPASGCARTGHLVNAASLEAGVDVQASFNNDAADIANYLPGAYGAGIPQLRFGEAAINLTRVLDEDFNDRCATFASTWMHSRSSSASVDAELKDYVAPTPLSVHTCKATPSLSSSTNGTVLRGRRHRHRRSHRRRLVLGGPIRDTAHLTDGATPTGTITFRLYGPNDADCSGPPIFTSSAAVDGNGYYGSGDFTPRDAGSYRWVVEYSGDRDNEPAGPTKCGLDSETVVVERAQPGLTTSASGPVMGSHRKHRLRRRRLAGHSLWDSAILSGGQAPTGTIHFRLYGPDDPDCSGPPAFTSTVSVSGNGVYVSEIFEASEVGVYRWVATYSGDSNNAPAGPTACGEDSETVVIHPAQPDLSTIASPSVTLGGAVFDTAILSGGSDPTGTVEFRLYGPNDADCSGSPLFTSKVPLSGNDPVNSATFTPHAAGTYRWTATYSGDHANHGAGPTHCTDPAEEVVVAAAPRAKPTITTAVTGGAAGSPVHDAATLSGSDNATGEIDFLLYGPGDDTCANAPVFGGSVTVSGDGTYSSPAFVPLQAGSYQWVARYAGDERNEPASTACGDEPLTVSKAVPALSTVASPDIVLGGVLRDRAHLSGAADPTGTITFTLFGPDDPACSGPPAFTAEVIVTRNGFHDSPSFAPPGAGNYAWIASYSGDGNNESAATGCTDPQEAAVVNRVATDLTTSVPRPRARVAGRPLADTAVLSGGLNPTGTITFRLYGPDDDSCSGPPAFISAIEVNGAGTYNSESFRPTLPGTYRWVAHFSGDPNNLPSGPTACGEASETVAVRLLAAPTLSSSASSAVTLGGAIFDVAHLSDGFNPGGTLTFNLYGPGDADCSGTPAFSSTVPVSGNGDYPSAPFTPPAAGVYRWKVSYSGDRNNHPAGPTACREASEAAFVRPPDIIPTTPSLSTTASAPGGIGSPLRDVAHLSGGTDPVGAITFQLFGPNDPSCAGPPAFTTTVPVSGNGDYVSDAHVPALAGEYRWVASYAGDANNTAAGPTACGDPAETVNVSSTPDAQPSTGPNARPARARRHRRAARHHAAPRFTG